jgi:hypothetical protein
VSARKRCRLLAVLLLVAGLPPQGAARAEDRVTPSAREFEDAMPEGQSLTGREIYRRFLANKFQSSFQKLRVVSTDPGGSDQVTHFTTSLLDLRDEDGNAIDGLRAKMLVEVQAPFDMRHTAYLMISKDPGPDDEFAYKPSQRRVSRVNLKKTSLMGTDFTFNDIAFQNLDDAAYLRHPDEMIDGVPVYVVEANLKRELDIEYHRTLTYLEKEHYVPLRTRYWDEFGVEAKEMTAPHDRIKSFGEVWVAEESTMHDLMQQTRSTLHVESLETDVTFERHVFAVSRLARGR